MILSTVFECTTVAPDGSSCGYKKTSIEVSEITFLSLPLYTVFCIKKNDCIQSIL